MEWRLLKFSKGALLGERKSGRVWRRSLQGEAKAGQSCATGGQFECEDDKDASFGAVRAGVRPAR